ncbi:hypothetical protein T492DRAFT_212765 [Pavlovales sp. CCMP2436]|nr:hypothetical protein T492DRAFT_212765 [Pavlovales sp. CCMP2436]
MELQNRAKYGVFAVLQGKGAGMRLASALLLLLLSAGLTHETSLDPDHGPPHSHLDDNIWLHDAVDAQSTMVLKLTTEVTGALGLRYFHMVETLPGELKASNLDGVRFIARGGGIPWFRQYVVTPGERQSTLIGAHSFVKANMFVRRFAQGYVAVGGENMHLPFDSVLREHYHRNFCPNDPLAWNPDKHIYCASGTWLMPVVNSFDDVLNGAWMTAEDERHTWKHGSMILPPRPAGCVDARAGPVCSLDGKLTMAFLHDRWLIFGRSNVKYNGGRFVQVAESAGAELAGPFGPMQLLDFDNYDSAGNGNIYFATVNAHPLNAGMLIGLFPVNTGNLTYGAGTDGMIGMAFSCDGEKWSELVPLIYSHGITGRTYDHPVDGLVWREGRLFFYVQHHVPHISPHAAYLGHLRQYSLLPGQLEALTATARGGPNLAATCAPISQEPRQPPAPPSPPSPPNPPPKPLPSPPPAPPPTNTEGLCRQCEDHFCGRGLNSAPSRSRCAARVVYIGPGYTLRQSCSCHCCAQQCSYYRGCDLGAAAYGTSELREEYKSQCTGFTTIDAHVKVHCDYSWLYPHGFGLAVDTAQLAAHAVAGRFAVAALLASSAGLVLVAVVASAARHLIRPGASASECTGGDQTAAVLDMM